MSSCRSGSSDNDGEEEGEGVPPPVRLEGSRPAAGRDPEFDCEALEVRSERGTCADTVINVV